jgi:CRP-like cAMP-binding protein
VQQGEHGDDLFLLVDGVLAVVVDGDEVGEIGPGAIVGELASLEDGRRTATLIARTACRVAVIPAELVDLQEKEDLAVGRR